MTAWGWRIPFLLGALIAPVGLFIRSRVDETPAYRQSQRPKATAAAASFPMARTMTLAFAFPILQSVLTYLFLSYLPTFGQKYVGLSPSAALWSTELATMGMGITAVLSGALSDVVGRRACLLGSCALSLVLAYPFITLMIGASTTTVIALHLGFAAINGLFLGPLASSLVEMFPTARRMTGLTIAYNLQSMIFGGFASVHRVLADRHDGPANFARLFHHVRRSSFRDRHPDAERDRLRAAAIGGQISPDAAITNVARPDQLIQEREPIAVAPRHMLSYVRRRARRMLPLEPAWGCVERRRAAPSHVLRLCAALISARCEKACGKLPSCRLLARIVFLREQARHRCAAPSSRSNRARASS